MSMCFPLFILACFQLVTLNTCRFLDLNGKVRKATINSFEEVSVAFFAYDEVYLPIVELSFRDL